MSAINMQTADFITTTLSGALAAGAASMTIGTGLNIPDANGILQLDYTDAAGAGVGADNGPETIHYTAYNTATGAITGMTRGMAGTTDVAHGNGALIAAAPSVVHLTGELGYAQITSNFFTATTGSEVDVTGLSTTVTVPAGGRRIKISVYLPAFNSSNAVSCHVSIAEGAAILTSSNLDVITGNKDIPISVSYCAVPTVGSHTYKVTVRSEGATTMTCKAAAASPNFILVEII